MKEVNRWKMAIDRNGDEANVYPVLDGEGDWVDHTCYELLERKNRELESQRERYNYVTNSNQKEIYELREKLSALAGVIVDLKK